MKFGTLYRISFYAMLIFAALVLSIDSPDSKIAILYPFAVLAAAVMAFLSVDRTPGTGLPAWGLNVLGLLATGLALLEFLYDTKLLVLALGHWVVYLSVILMFRAKSVLSDWEMYLLGLVQVIVGAVISQSDTVGEMLFLWAILALWVLGLFSLRREALRARVVAPEAPSPEHPDAGRSDEFYPALLNLPFLLSGLRVTLTTLALGGVIFLAMPRRSDIGKHRNTGGSPSQHLTGFDDEVQLGQMGEILENDTVVMSVELYDDEGRRTSIEGEPLWRGVTMSDYRNGRWHRQPYREFSTFPIVHSDAIVRADQARSLGIIRQQIRLQANDSNVLFGLRPMVSASNNSQNEPNLNKLDGTIFRSDSMDGAYDYSIRSFSDHQLPQPGETAPGQRYLRELRQLPEGMRERLKRIADRQIATRIPPEARDDPRMVAKALEAYFQDPAEFTYTLKLDVVDRTLDPVEDFLVNRKKGHCEYFASGLALLLRSVGIPSRVVHGFKGGDYNELSRMINVRQLHAHSWVEAYLGEESEGERTPTWLTLDPTPGNARDVSVAKVSGLKGKFRKISDFFRFVWLFYIVGYNSERQNQLVYAPLQSLVNEAGRGFKILGNGFLDVLGQVRRLLHFPDAQALVSVRGFVVSFVGLLMLAGLIYLSRWLGRLVLRWYAGEGEEASALSAGAAHYRRLALLLAGYGLERPPAETQEEFARRATLFLTARGSNTEAVAEVPRLVVEAFYRVRFGRHALDPDRVRQMDARLDALEASLNASQA